MYASAACNLRPGGRFVAFVMNPEQLEARVVAVEWDRFAVDADRDRHLVETDRRALFAGRRA